MNEHLDPVAAIVVALRALPANATVAWCDVSCQFAPGVHPARWVDIYVVEPDFLPAWAWVWTIVDATDHREDRGAVWVPGRRPEPTAWHIGLVPDRTVAMVCQREPGGWTWLDAGMTVMPRGAKPSDAGWLRLKQVQRDYPRSRITTEDAWTTELICAALTSWAAAFADRGDLRFVEDPSDAALDAAAARLGLPASFDDEELYAIGDGVKATSSALDGLLSIRPEEAAEATQLLQELARQNRGTAPQPAADE